MSSIIHFNGNVETVNNVTSIHFQYSENTNTEIYCEQYKRAKTCSEGHKYNIVIVVFIDLK